VIAEAIDTGTRIGWAIVAWIAVGAAALTVVLFTAVLTGAWAMRGAWRAVRRGHKPVSRPRTLSRGSRDADAAPNPAQARTAPRRAHDEQEAA
jgi:hypothetical protein